MITFKCKMCGGDLEFEQGSSVAECPYCGSRQTLPRLDDDKRANLYDRANHFRRQNEYDKAMAIYEQILQEDRTDAEAYWSLVLCRYGIEYVEDPASRKRVPTVNRVQYTSILADEDYKNALQYADAAQRNLYEDEAGAIAEIQKGILDISRQEKPFDVFICYKETDANGRRTPDSVLANDLYHQLTNEGFKVFFSRITLEDKIGSAYEPYIFAALNSAKVMVVLGTKPEYFKAVWVKNEWSRYLALIRAGADKVLVPAYRDMDPYDLPEEFAHLQAQDMGKLGFMQDLIRGIKKITAKDEPKAQQAAERVTVTGANIENLMKRVRLFMEDGDFSNANDYLDKVLDEDAEYAPAYAAKTCTALGFRREAELGGATFLYGENGDWLKALRFASPAQKAVYEGYYEQVKARVRRQIRDYAFDCAMDMATNPDADRKHLDQELAEYKASCEGFGRNRADGSRRARSSANEAQFNKAVSENKPGIVSDWRYKAASEMFGAIGDDRGEACAQSCLLLAEQARQKAIYDQASKKAELWHDASVWESLAEQFMTVPDYLDAREQAEKCREKAKTVRDTLYTKAVQAIREAGDDSLKWKEAQEKLAHADLNGYLDVEALREDAKQRYEECRAAEAEAQRRAKLLAEQKAKKEEAKQRLILVIALLVIALAVAAFFVATKIIIPKGHYDKGISFRENQNWREAVSEFIEAGEYSDAKAQITETYYQAAVALEKAGRYEEAIAGYRALNGYGDSAARIEACETGIIEREYQAAVALQEAGRYEEAIAAFRTLNGYGDSAAQIAACEESIKEREYQAAVALQEAGRYEEAIAAFRTLNGYGDSAARIEACETGIKERAYQAAAAQLKAGKYAEAYAAFKELTGYKDVDSLMKSDENLLAIAREEKLKLFKTVGSVVTFGTYPQTGSGSDKTPVEWIVLDVQGNKSLLISRHGLDAKPYNKEFKTITWEHCTLRTWLNGTFLNEAFTAQEQTGILTTNVDNSSSQGNSAWRTSGGNNTQDRVFLLSYAEAEKYFATDDARKCVPTDYAVKQGASTSRSEKVDGKPTCYWWLRSPSGSSQDRAANVSDDGNLGYYNNVGYGRNAVRPAFWVNLDSEIFDLHSPEPDNGEVIDDRAEEGRNNSSKNTYNVSGFSSFKVTIEIDENGRIVSVSVPEHGETPGLGADLIADSKVFEELIGRDIREASIDARAGVTLTSNAINDALSQAALEFENNAKLSTTTTSTPKPTPKPTPTPTPASTETQKTVNYRSGWYVSDDGKYAIQPSNLRKSGNGYKATIRIRDERLGAVLGDTDITIDPGELFGAPRLMQNKAVQDFVSEGNGKYSFNIVCDFPGVDDLSFSQSYSFTIK